MSEPRYAYTIELTRDEYRSADYMSVRGYLGCLTDRRDGKIEEWSDDEETVTIKLTESAAWDIHQICEDDPITVWSLTTRQTTLGAKFQSFLDSIV